MTVTEFAILPLTHRFTKESSALPSQLIEKLKAARIVLEKSSGHQFRYFQQVEDPSIVYIFGNWDSVSAHQAFLPSQDNQQLLELFKDDVLTEGEKKMQMWHLDGDLFNGVNEWQMHVLEAPTISCNRHFVPTEKKEGFQTKFEEVRGLLEDFTKPYKVVGGWRIEKDSEEEEEWALFSGFQSVNNHMEFAKTEGFAKYRELVDFVKGFEVRHLTAIEGL